MTGVLVVIPTYNERESLAEIVGRVHTAVPDADMLIVDDSSPDGTGRLADELASRNSRVSVLHRPSRDGLGRAYLAGFSRALEAGYEFVVEIDADGSHDPAELPRMLQLARERADLVIGSRWAPGGSVSGWPWLRQAVSRIGNAYARAALASDVRDITAGFRVFRSETLTRLDLNSVASQGYCFQVELAWRVEQAGLVIVEHPIAFVERASGQSKMHLGIVIEALLRVTAWGFGRIFRR